MNESMDPAVVAADVYKLALENSRVRVFNVTFAPGAKAAWHQHPDHVIHVLTDANLHITSLGGKTMDIAPRAGDTLWMEAGPHEAVNTGSAVARLLVVELK
jgi:quercetin dioxygenase-like cupin family protein